MHGLGGYFGSYLLFCFLAGDLWPGGQLDGGDETGTITITGITHIPITIQVFIPLIHLRQVNLGEKDHEDIRGLTSESETISMTSFTSMEKLMPHPKVMPASAASVGHLPRIAPNSRRASHWDDDYG